MTTENADQGVLELLVQLRSHLEAYPKDTQVRDELRHLVQEMDGGGGTGGGAST